MACINSYATLADLLAFITPRGQTIAANVPEEAVLERLLQSVSRYFDSKTDHHFYPWVQTRWFDTPGDDDTDLRNLRMDADLLEIIAITNGNGIAVPSSAYYVIPANEYPITDIHLRDIAPYQWYPDVSGNTHSVIQVQAIWGERGEYDIRGWVQAGTLSAAMTDTTTASFSSAATLVTSQIVRIDNELLIVSGNSSPYSVRQRGENGSTAATHLNGAPIYVWQVEDDLILATLETCNNIISSRFGQSSAGRITFTAAGIVIRPDDISALGKDIINGYRRRL
jgi:hypothetical protein